MTISMHWKICEKIITWLNYANVGVDSALERVNTNTHTLTPAYRKRRVNDEFGTHCSGRVSAPPTSAAHFRYRKAIARGTAEMYCILFQNTHNNTAKEREEQNNKYRREKFTEKKRDWSSIIMACKSLFQPKAECNVTINV